ncbi:NAD(P)H-dependent oxidoreductase [Luteolibacter sp. Populi]|uniref:NAD(P)H-dependent oxidoreductase n=1 Tax=Luteolibacter sp. Populi TaxID=3230487 RepID=UPI003466D7CD
MSSPANTITTASLLERLNWRYATKQFDPERKISPEDWSALEEALVLSPSSGGLQPGKFIVVTDPAIREKLVPASYGQAQVKDASHLVVFTAKTNFGEADVDAHLERIAEVRGVPLESLAQFRGMLLGGIVNAMDAPARQAWAARQAYIALGNLLTSAALLGIDACPMEGFAPDQYDSILGLKDKGLTSVVICPIGYRAETDAYAGLAKVRFAKEDSVIHV